MIRRAINRLLRKRATLVRLLTDAPEEEARGAQSLAVHLDSITMAIE